MPRIIISIIAFFALCNSVFAASFYNELFMTVTEDKIELNNSLTGGQFGADIATGDFNGDGLEDVAVGAPFSSLASKEWNGSVSLLLGEKGKKSKKLTFFGANVGDQFGTVLESGDFNNDDIDDLAIGSYSAYQDEKRPGRVDILYGVSTFDSLSGEFIYFKPDKTLFGEWTDDAFGMSLSTMDVNHDDIEDLVVGAPFNKGKGAVYGYTGGPSGVSDLAKMKLQGQLDGERFGSIVVGDDIDDDGKDELVVGAYYAGTEQQGRVYLYKNAKGNNGMIEKVNLTLEGAVANEWFGFDLSVGDLNGDGFKELAVSSFPYNGELAEAKVQIFKGNASGFEVAASSVIHEAEAGLALGARTYFADLDGDGKEDLVMGAPGVGDPVSVQEGDVFVLYGKDELKELYSLRKGEIDSVIHGENADDWFGYSLGSGDFNEDGFVDLVVGSRYSDTKEGINNGKVFVLLGNGGKFGIERGVVDEKAEIVTRADLVLLTLEKFDLKNKKADLISQCYEHLDFCLHNFTVMSAYDEVKLTEPLILYPDMMPNTPYYEEVVLATILGLINGYAGEEDSPFKPQASVSRIQALKVILSAADLVPLKYRFELPDEQKSYFEDVDSKILHMWWYFSYVNFAVENGIVEAKGLFRPDDPITMDELNQWIDSTLEFLNSSDEEAQS